MLTRSRIGPDVALWFYFAQQLRMPITKYSTMQLKEVRDEAHSWMLFNRHLQLNTTGTSIIYKCLTSALNSLTDLELERVSGIGIQ